MTQGPPVPMPPLVAFDANVFDRLGKTPDDLARMLCRLLDERRIRLFVPPGVAAEVSHPNAPPEIRSALQAGASPPYTRRTARQDVDRIRVRAILRGDGRPGKHDADASHLSDAAEAGCSAFVTQDGKVLRKRDILGPALPPGLCILTPDELLARLAGVA